MNTLHSSPSAKLISALLAVALAALTPVILAKGGGGGGKGGGSTTVVPPPPPNPVDVIMGMYDTNHDGQLDKSELQKMHDLEPDKCAEALKWDANKSLSLDRNEINAWKDFLQKKAAADRAAAAASSKGGG